MFWVCVCVCVSCWLCRDLWDVHLLNPYMIFWGATQNRRLIQTKLPINVTLCFADPAHVTVISEKRSCDRLLICLSPHRLYSGHWMTHPNMAFIDYLWHGPWQWHTAPPLSFWQKENTPYINECLTCVWRAWWMCWPLLGIKLKAALVDVSLLALHDTYVNIHLSSLNSNVFGLRYSFWNNNDKICINIW